MEHPLLDKYFLEGLSGEELVEFNRLLKEDPAFKETFEFEKSVQKIAQQERRETLKDTLRTYEDQRMPKVTKQSKSKRFMAIAASIALFACATWLYFGQSKETNEDLYAANYTTYPNTVYSITRGDENDDSLEYEAFLLYEKGNYDEAMLVFEQLKITTEHSYMSFYMAQTELARGREIEALALFKTNTENGSQFIAESRWYQSLILIKTEQYKEASFQLETLIELGTYKKEESQDLLKTLQDWLTEKD